MDIQSVAPPMPLKVRFADAGLLCMYNKEGLESGVLGIEYGDRRLGYVCK